MLTSAVDLAAGIQVYNANATAPSDIVCFSASFHGRTMGALALTYKEQYKTPFAPVMPGAKLATYQDLDSAAQLIKKVRHNNLRQSRRVFQLRICMLCTTRRAVPSRPSFFTKAMVTVHSSSLVNCKCGSCPLIACHSSRCAVELMKGSTGHSAVCPHPPLFCWVRGHLPPLLTFASACVTAVLGCPLS